MLASVRFSTSLEKNGFLISSVLETNSSCASLNTHIITIWKLKLSEGFILAFFESAKDCYFVTAVLRFGVNSSKILTYITTSYAFLLT